MADVTLTVHEASRLVASAPNYTANLVAATSADTYFIPSNNGRVLLLCAAATTSNLTVETPNGVDGLAVTDLVNALTSAIRVLGPFPPSIYNDAQGRVKFSVSANTNVFAVRLP